LSRFLRADGWRAEPWPYDSDVLAVNPSPEPRPPLHGPSLLAAITSLRAAYHYTVIDTSSILTGLDVPLLEGAADGMVIAARARHTRARTLHAALEQAGAARVLGVVLMDVQPRRASWPLPGSSTRRTDWRKN